MEDYLSCSSGSPYTEFLSPRGVLTSLRCSRGLDRADSVEAAFEIPTITLSAVEASSLTLHQKASADLSQLLPSRSGDVDEQFLFESECEYDCDQMVLVTRKTSQVTTVVNLGSDDDAVACSSVVQDSVTSSYGLSTSAQGKSGQGSRDSVQEADDGSRSNFVKLPADSRRDTELADSLSKSRQAPESLPDSISAVRSQATAAISSLRPALRAVRRIWRSDEASPAAEGDVQGRQDGVGSEANQIRRRRHDEKGVQEDKDGIKGGFRDESEEGKVEEGEEEEDMALEGGDVVLKPMSAAMSNSVYECVWLPNKDRRGVVRDRQDNQNVQGSSAKAEREGQDNQNGEESSAKEEKRVLVRVYGPATSMLSSRAHEEAVSRAMSDLGLGPKLLASFGTGRVEEFLQAKALTAEEMRQTGTSRQIAECMRRFHSMRLPGSNGPEDVVSCLWSRLRRWLSLAQLLHPWGVHGANPRQLGEEIRRLEAAVGRRWGERGTQRGGGTQEEGGAQEEGGSQGEVRAEAEVQGGVAGGATEAREGEMRGRWIGLCHMDLQHGNIMKERGTGRIVIIDYEYSGYAHVAFDIANHFCEMAADYDTPEPHLLDYCKYPSLDEQQWFVNCYLSAAPSDVSSGSSFRHSNAPLTSSLDASDAEELMQAVDVFLPVCHLHWFLWGVISAAVSDAEFDYMEYAQQRLHEFRKCVDQLEAIQVI